MVRFSIGDEVVILFGQRQGQTGEVIEIQSANVYKVRVADGSILYYAARGLVKESEKLATALSVAAG